LQVVSSGPMHGYAIIKELSRRSGGRFDLPEGTVYPALDRLEREGLLESWWSEAAGRKRRCYAITKKGRIALGEQTEHWWAFADAMKVLLDAR
jgi:PadR family transcriptional regulator PadR